MVGRGGGKKTGTHKIAPGRLWSCAQASRNNLLKKKNVDGINNNVHPCITDDIALIVSKNLDRQRKGCANNIPALNESANLFDYVSSPVQEIEDNAANNIVGNGVNNTTQNDENEQAESQGVIPSFAGDLLGKRKRESNFVTRIEVGLALNNAVDPRPRENPIPSEVDQVNRDDLDVNTATSKTKAKGERGRYKSFVVDMKIKGKGSKLRVSIPNDVDRAIGENARHLVNECGRVVRTRAPFNVKNWNEAFEEAGDSMLKEIKDKFEISQCGDYLRMHMFIVETMQRLYRLFKCRLHYYYKKCGKTDDERIKNPPPDLPQSQWEYLVSHYGSHKFKIVSARNSKNRKSDKRVKHTIGTLSFPESEDILTKKNGNVKPPADVIWLVQHTHKNDGQLEWLNNDPRSKQIHENLKNVVATADDSMTQEDILTQVLGHRSGYVRGKGTGVRAYVKGKVQAEQCKIVEQQQEKILEQEQKIKDLEEIQSNQQREFEAYKAQQKEEIELLKQFIKQQLAASGAQIP